MSWPGAFGDRPAVASCCPLGMAALPLILTLMLTGCSYPWERAPPLECSCAWELLLHIGVEVGPLWVLVGCDFLGLVAGCLLLLRSGLFLYLQTWAWFPCPFSLKTRMQQLLLDAFIQILVLHVFDTVPAGVCARALYPFVHELFLENISISSHHFINSVIILVWN